MLSLYRQGDGVLHRMPTGAKLLLVGVLVLGVSLLPATWLGAVVAVAVAVIAYAAAGLGDGMLGMRTLATQGVAVRWIVALMLVFQLVFLGPEAAVANTARVTAAIVLAGLLALTTRVSALLETIERGLEPLRRLGLDPQRSAMLLAVTLTTIPVLGRLAREVREAQRARGSRGSIRHFAMPMLVASLRHADELGEALAARGVR